MSYENENAYQKAIDQLANSVDHDFTEFEELGQATENFIHDLCVRFRKEYRQVLSDLTEASKNTRRMKLEDDELKYGHLDEYGDNK